MRIFKNIALFSVAFIAAVSCVTEKEESFAQEQEIVFTADFETGQDTRTVLVNGMDVYWLPGDCISVCGASRQFVSNAVKQSKITTFSGFSPSSDVYYAVYPYGAVDSWDGNVATVTIPEWQTATKGSFANNLNVSASCTSSSDLTLSFHNVLGYIKFGVDENSGSIISVKVTANGGESLSGLAEISFDQQTGLPSITSTSETSSVTLYSVSALDPGYYYIAMIPGVYKEGLTLTIVYEDDEVVQKSIDSRLVLNAGVVQNIGTIVGSEPEDGYYKSKDYSIDGKVCTLQTASKGNGIDVVLMGDGYSDRQIKSGLYETDMKFIYSHLFDEEPYKSFKDLFNVYYVNVVSATEGYDYEPSALEGFFGEGTEVGGNDEICFEYAYNVLSDERLDEALIIVVMNKETYAGTCYMYYPLYDQNDYGSGVSVAYFPKSDDLDEFAQVLHHEACGHGFAKLNDEYYYWEYGSIPSNEVSEYQMDQEDFGWWKNVDFTSNKSKVLWSHFIEDERYDAEGIDVYEGACTYYRGAYRPTWNSIMVDNVDGFNAPSREAIYYRIHKLAYGKNWEYDYEDFVEYDTKNVTSAYAPDHNHDNYVEKAFTPTAPPVVIRKPRNTSSRCD